MVEVQGWGVGDVPAGCETRHTMWMEPQSTQGSNDSHTTNQVTNSLKLVSMREEVKYALIWLQLKDKFCLSFSQLS